jgi:hypothetical protein
MPWQYERLTPAEFLTVVDGYHRRQEHEWYRAAWMVSHLLAAWTKKAPTPDKLLGPAFRARRRRRRRGPDGGDDE